jgi:hypothetical protein
MKPIDTKTHGYMDYIMGVFLLASPSLFELDKTGMQSTIFYISAAAVFVYSILTHYEVGLVKIIPMKIHLLLDVLSGILLAASPWLFNFHETVYGPHLVLGIIEISTALLSSSRPMREIKA